MNKTKEYLFKKVYLYDFIVDMSAALGISKKDKTIEKVQDESKVLWNLIFEMNLYSEYSDWEEELNLATKNWN